MRERQRNGGKRREGGIGRREKRERRVKEGEKERRGKEGKERREVEEQLFTMSVHSLHDPYMPTFDR